MWTFLHWRDDHDTQRFVVTSGDESQRERQTTAAEVTELSRGLGYLLQFAQSTYDAGLTMALIVLIMAFVLVLFALAERFERRLLRWR